MASVRSRKTKNLNRQRVVEFEKEMTLKLATLANIERDIAEVSEKRRIWLQSISKSDETGLDVFIAKLNILKLRAHLSSLHMTQDVLTLEGHYESQELNYLVSATQPMDEGETEAQRKASLARLQRDDSDVMLKFLEHSLQLRIRLGNTNYELQSTLKLIIDEIGLQQIAEEEEFQEKVAYYTSRMRASKELSGKHYQRLTEEYLVLRHNARVAKEVLTRSQNDAAKARTELQSCLDSIVHEAAVQREKMEKNSTSELSFLTEDLRSEVVRREAEVETLTQRVQLLKSTQKKEASQLKKDLRVYTLKYKSLQKKRKGELRVIQSELSHLREMIGSVEQRLQDVDINALDSPTGVDAATIDETAHKAMMKLRLQLKNIDRVYS